MKKLLLIIVLSLLLSGNVFAEIFEMKNCYYQGDDKTWNEENWLKKSSAKELLSIDPNTGKRNYSNKKYQKQKDVILSIDTNSQMIFVTTINTRKYLDQGKIVSDFYLDTKAGLKEKMETLNKANGDPNSELAQSFWKNWVRSFKNRQLVEQEEYNLLTFVDNMAIGFRNKGITREKIFVDVEKGTFTSGYTLDGNNLPQFGGDICNNQISSTDGDASGSSGTAFFVSNRGHLITNHHVVEGCTISKITYQNNDYDTKLIATDKTLDLALLKVEIRPKSFFNFSKDEPKKLDKVYIAGYPLGKGLSDDLKMNPGVVSSLKGFGDNSNEIQIDAPINPGNSGGPIINENGDLIAIAVSGLAKDQTEGINFGIKSSAAELFLKSNKVTPKKATYSGIKDNDKLREILEQGTVYTYCD
jgi:S1-C subfamily serine protease